MRGQGFAESIRKSREKVNKEEVCACGYHTKAAAATATRDKNSLADAIGVQNKGRACVLWFPGKSSLIGYTRVSTSVPDNTAQGRE